MGNFCFERGKTKAAQFATVGGRGCDPQILHFLQLVLANLSTLAHDVKGLHAATREFSKFFKHRVQDLGTHGPDTLLNATPVNGP